MIRATLVLLLAEVVLFVYFFQREYPLTMLDGLVFFAALSISVWTGIRALLAEARARGTRVDVGMVFWFPLVAAVVAWEYLRYWRMRPEDRESYSSWRYFTPLKWD
jgi:hypothetical protein